jgi:hypothetical protein
MRGELRLVDRTFHLAVIVPLPPRP